MKRRHKKIWKCVRNVSIGASVMAGIAKGIDSISKLSSESEEHQKKTFNNFLKFGGVALGGLLLYKFFSDKSEAKKYHEERIADANAEEIISTTSKKDLSPKNTESYLGNESSEEIIDYQNELEESNIQSRKVYTSKQIFEELENQSQDWILDGFIRPEQISFIVGGGSSGKSIIMTDIAIALSKGVKPLLLPDECNDSMKLDVLSYRIEVFNQELQGKYGKGQILKDSDIGWRKVDELSSFTLEGLIEAFKLDAGAITKPTVILADPVTKIPGYNHKVFIAGAEEAMKIAAQRGIPLSIVASAHLDEIDDWKSVTSSDIKGGDILFQQAGAVVAICKGRGGKNYRFLKCLKPAKGSPTPFDEKVIVIRSEKTKIDEENWYVHYVFDSIKNENEALPLKPKPEKQEKVEEEGDTDKNKYEMERNRIFSERWLDPMFTKQQIADELGVSTRTLQRWREELCLPDRNEIRKQRKI